MSPVSVTVNHKFPKRRADQVSLSSKPSDLNPRVVSSGTGRDQDGLKLATILIHSLGCSCVASVLMKHPFSELMAVHQ